MNTSSPTTTFPFILESEVENFRARRPLEFDISTAIHELLGHGSGLLLAETEPGVFNFDHKNPPVSPLDGKPIWSWYKVGQTFSSVFGRINGAYSECHAECTALFLADNTDIMRLFGCSDEPGHTGFDEGTSLTHCEWTSGLPTCCSPLYFISGHGKSRLGRFESI